MYYFSYTIRFRQNSILPCRNKKLVISRDIFFKPTQIFSSRYNRKKYFYQFLSVWMHRKVVRCTFNQIHEYFCKQKYMRQQYACRRKSRTNSVRTHNCSWTNTMGRLWITRGERRIDSSQINNFLPRARAQPKLEARD